MNDSVDAMRHHRKELASYAARHFLWSVSDDGKVGTITLNRPDRKNPLTFDSYAELRDLFRALNDIAVGEHIVPGTRVKIVSDE